MYVILQPLIYSDILNLCRVDAISFFTNKTRLQEKNLQAVKVVRQVHNTFSRVCQETNKTMLHLNDQDWATEQHIKRTSV